MDISATISEKEVVQVQSQKLLGEYTRMIDIGTQRIPRFDQYS